MSFLDCQEPCSYSQFVKWDPGLQLQLLVSVHNIKTSCWKGIMLGLTKETVQRRWNLIKEIGHWAEITAPIRQSQDWFYERRTNFI